MKTAISTLGMGVLMSVLGMQATAQAQVTVPDPDPNGTQVGAGTPSEALPPPRSDNDAQPPVAAPMAPGVGVTSQAGVGGTQAYGRAGVLELGGSAGFTLANTFNRFEISPFVGLFIADNLQISAIGAYSRFHIDGEGAAPNLTASEFKLLLEPSYHLPFSEILFGFFGLGAGVNYLNEEVGFALAPRLGLNILVGRSGILTPSLNVAYSSVDAVQLPGGGTVLGVQTSYGMNIGYTVMW